MGKRSIISALLLICLLATGGCAGLQSAQHQFVMRGQVLEVADNMAYLCIGKNDGAQVGQELAVYRFSRSGSLTMKYQKYYFKKEKIGSVKIEDVFDEHFSHARILTGNVRENDVVELN